MAIRVRSIDDIIASWSKLVIDNKVKGQLACDLEQLLICRFKPYHLRSNVMAYWVTFSNGVSVCQTYPAGKLLTIAKQLGCPLYYEGTPYELPNISKMTSEQRNSMDLAKNEILETEAQEYADKRWPNKNITVKQRQSLPYGSTPAFGSGSTKGHFCYTPSACAGRGSCPRRRACSE